MSTKMNKIKNGRDLNGFQLSTRADGVTFRKGNTTAYHGVGMPDVRHIELHGGGYTFAIDITPAEAAIIGRHPSAFWQPGNYETILDAAYAHKVFNMNREANIKSLVGLATFEWDCGIIPEHAYPDAIDTAEHVAYRDGKRASQHKKYLAISKAKSRAKAKRNAATAARVAARDAERLAKALAKALAKEAQVAALFAAAPEQQLLSGRGHAIARQLFGAEVFIQVGRKFTKAVVDTAIKYLTVGEFATRFGIESRADINRLAQHRGPFNRA